MKNLENQTIGCFDLCCSSFFLRFFLCCPFGFLVLFFFFFSLWTEGIRFHSFELGFGVCNGPLPGHPSVTQSLRSEDVEEGGEGRGAKPKPQTYEEKGPSIQTLQNMNFPRRRRRLAA